MAVNDISGVPPLLSGLIPLPQLLSADASIGLLQNGPELWGVFLGGAPVVLFDTFVSIDYRQGWALSDYPVERGAFETYDKVQLPFDVRVRFAAGGSEANRQALIDSVAAISGTLTLYSVVTPEVVYNSVNVQHYDYRRTNANGLGLITIEMWLLEVRVTADSSPTSSATSSANQSAAPGPSGSLQPFTSQPPLTNTVDPSGMSAFNDGFVTSQSSPGTFNVLPVQ